MRRALHIVVYLVAGLVGIVVLAVAAVYGLSSYRMSRAYDLPAADIEVPSDAATIERGRHLVVAVTKCADCHGENLAGNVFIDDPALGRVVAPNLTLGGRGGQLSAADWERAIRHGVGADGRPLVIMPSEDWYQLSDDDLGAMIAYIRSLPAVQNELPSLTVGPLGRLLYLSGALPLLPAERIDHDAPRTLMATPALNVEYGRYLATTGGCMGCHNPNLSGGPIPGAPPEWPAASNITPEGIGSWNEHDFFRALREGKRPDGSDIDPVMPWKATAQMTDEEIKALYLYIQSVPARPTGER